MKKLFSFFILLLNLQLFAQADNPVKWNITSKALSDCEYEIIFTGTIEKEWHVYSLNKLGDDGPMPSAITIEKSKLYEPKGKPTEGKAIKTHDKVFDVDVMFFENSVTFKQRIKLNTDKEVTVKGTYEYQACTEEKCIFPPATPFEIKLKGSASCIVSANEIVQSTLIAAIDTPTNEKSKADTLISVQADSIVKPNTIATSDESASIEGKVWWIIFLTGFGWGFLALFTPCVFPLIPMNVSFFLKRSKDKAKGKWNALVYAFSIIIIFVVLGLGISVIWGGGALNTFATSAGFNLVIFLLLLIFAASFLGAFEIVLPSSFVNKIDKQSDRGGYAGIFFMALTLVVVSFSCTGPMVGNALVAASTSGNKSGAFWAMFGFSSGLALPFGLFAFFPSMLNSLPKSGGWLNTVKVVLGFLELALALKFASNVDLVYQLGILTREVFITFWIVIFALTTIYLLGGFKTAHDSAVEFLSVTRLMFVILFFSITIYLIPGLWGAPLKLFSGVLPPADYAESPNGVGGTSANIVQTNKPTDDEYAKYIEYTKSGIPHFKNDYEHALAYARKMNKPLMVDFTGHACANCRKTEDYIWPDAAVSKRLSEDVVLVSLYVDDKRKLDEKDFMKVFWFGQEREITTIGDKYKYLEEEKYHQSTQPLYVLLDNNENLLNNPRGYQSGIEDYIKWLDEGINVFEKK
jgi:thiol:disulfide interchange protein